tara:strand:- start:572 stop:844 length:273 start_codon:yes stop_codon:yes gene_type:complete
MAKKPTQQPPPTEAEYKRVIKQAEEASNLRSQWEGRLAVAMEALRDEFDVDTIKQAEALLVVAEADVAKAEKRYNRELTKFKKEFGDDLG